MPNERAGEVAQDSMAAVSYGSGNFNDFKINNDPDVIQSVAHGKESLKDIIGDVAQEGKDKLPHTLGTIFKGAEEVRKEIINSLKEKLQNAFSGPEPVILLKYSNGMKIRANADDMTKIHAQLNDGTQKHLLYHSQGGAKTPDQEARTEAYRIANREIESLIRDVEENVKKACGLNNEKQSI